jgi:histidine ammonia-lyase
MHSDDRSGDLPLTGHDLTIEDIVDVARRARPVQEVTPASPAYQLVEDSAEWVRAVVEDNARRVQAGEEARAYYGINTGFGIHAAGRPMADPEYPRQVSYKLIMSHATGVGDYLDREVVRAAMLIRANTLVKGRSGVRPLVINRLIQMLNRHVTPAVPRVGSLGASGDLAPLSHLALVMSRTPESLADRGGAPGFDGTTGEAFVPLHDEGGQVIGCKLVPGAEAMTWDGTDRRLVLEAKEGLALNNGTACSAALAVLALHDAEDLVRSAEIAVAMTLEALQGYRDAFLPQVHLSRGHPGQIATAANVLDLVEGSQLVDPGDVDRDPVGLPPQDAYSLRCAPQVIGAVRETLAHVREMLERECNAATDNPLIFVHPDDGLTRPYKTISGGNFHGEYVAFGMDHLSIALAELGSISERRTFWLLNPRMARGLPSMLVRGDDSQIDSGLMITQYVAAALVSKSKTLAHPDSVDSIPTSADQEDHVSMSMNAGLHAREVVENITAVVAIELLAAVTALRHRLAGTRRDGSRGEPLSPDVFGRGTRATWEALREHAPRLFRLPLEHDAILYPYLRGMIDVVQSGVPVEAVRAAGISLREVRSSTQVTPG